MRVFDKNRFCEHVGFEFAFSIIDRGERCAEVERILAILMKSRVGLGAVYEYLPPIFSFPIEPKVNYDLMPSGSLTAGPGAVAAVLHAASHSVGIRVTKKASQYQASDPSHITPQAQARGSPFFSGV